MLSRAANSMYWMSRYVERAENVARFIEVNINLILDAVGHEHQWTPLVKTTGDDELFEEIYGEPTQANVIRFLTFEKRNPNSIISCLLAARENASQVRGYLSEAVWEQLNTFYLAVRGAKVSSVVSSPQPFYNIVKRESHLLVGLLECTMSQDEGYHFCRLGRLIERADKTSRILDVKYYLLLPATTDVGTPIDDIQWSSVLRSASALDMYRRLYHAIAPNHVVEFLLLNREFPRAVHFCLLHADESVHAISGTQPGTFCNDAELRLGQLKGDLSFTRVDDIIAAGLHEFVDGLQVRLNLIGESIHDTFCALRPIAGSAPVRKQKQQ